MVFEGLGLQHPFKIKDFQPKDRLEIFQNSCVVFISIFNNFESLFEQFWYHFWRLGVVLGWFWEPLGIAMRQIRGFGCSFVALRSQLGPRNQFWNDF